MSYSRLPSFVLGFHGCDRTLANRVVSHREHLKSSENEYDWLGHGIYFWENSPARAMIWAEAQAARIRAKGGIFESAVIGAIIDLGKCLDLLNTASIDLVEQAYRLLKQVRDREGVPLPSNENLPGSAGYLLRKLDCAVISFLHGTSENSDPFDSVRAAFVEGEPIYHNAGFRRHNHIQICVRNNANIKGYFRPFD
ncbi:MAG TPA: hypothetical protein VFE47_29675 [Tepidisphaeraceae bacterium]|jgi:hypothetical protein|nr:hypothetical protein [Tepidisphaeraceae bacterium]